MNRSEALVIARAAKKTARCSKEERFWIKVDILGNDDCWQWKASVRRKDEGYGAFWFNGRHHPSNRIAWLFTNGEIPDGLCVCHRCDNPGCCNPDHLFLGTHRENNDDKVSKGRHVFGERVCTARLTGESVLEILKLKPKTRAKYGERKAIAEKYGVSSATITDVWGRRWNHLK